MEFIAVTILGGVILILFIVYIVRDWLRQADWDRHIVVLAAIRDAIHTNLSGFHKVEVSPSAASEIDDTESALYVMRQHPSRTVRAAGLVMEEALKTISGEEMARAGRKELFSQMIDGFTKVQTGIVERSSNQLYGGLTEVVQAALTRGHLKLSQSSEAVSDFKTSVERCIAFLDGHQPGPAFSEMMKWQRRFREAVDDALPAQLVPVALIATEAVIDIYGEPIGYEQRFAEHRNKDVKKLLRQTLALLESNSMDSQALLGILRDWERLATPRPPSARYARSGTPQRG